MGHRSGGAFHRASARDLGVLALGVVLVITGVGLSTFDSLGDLTKCLSTVGALPRGEQA
ncbi:MAG: hypothetical protein M3237_12725 [Actinomycetota bacterium]|nr:hypothetical protein [Actinomycetota bacterium]